MRRRIFIKKLTPAELGQKKTKERYIRLPNDFNHEAFFQEKGQQINSVIQIDFEAKLKNDGENVALKFVHYINSNKEKRIPSLGQVFDKYNALDNNVIYLESITEGNATKVNLSFLNSSKLQLSNDDSQVYYEIEDDDDTIKKVVRPQIIGLSLQKIFYGAPGTGKSHKLDTNYVKGNKCFRITFHPDTDYASFVGCYKPKMGGPTGEDITYSFVPQVFLNAYIYAWDHPDEPAYLVIEELNRGNCAQIFGDIFQLLDRQNVGFPGYSKYTINADSDIAAYLEGKLEYKKRYEKTIREIYNLKEFDFSILALSPNLYILATMNTSDQSLFPIDSAFKRRWEMEYVGVNYADAAKFTVKIDEKHKYSWDDVLKGLNVYIKQEKHSTNKILGNRFVQADESNVISAVMFRDKVLFFLFNDVFKDEDEFRTVFFGGDDNLYFEDLCEGNDSYVINFIEKICKATNKANNQQPDGAAPQQSEKESTTETE